MKKCPYCAEELPDEAIVCRHCGRVWSLRHVTERRPAIQEIENEVIASKTTNTNVPKCLTCGSTDIQKITIANKAVKLALLGILSGGAISKTFKCNNCGYKW